MTMAAMATRPPETANDGEDHVRLASGVRLRDVAAWAHRLGFVRHRYTADAATRRWLFASPRARGQITVAHQPHLAYPWTVALDAGGSSSSTPHRNAS